jgi:hypothetical protein
MRFTRLIFTAALTAVLMVPSQASAQGTGLGVVVGEPTGVTARFMRGGNNFQVHAAWSFIDEGAFRISGDYLRSGTVGEADFPPFYFGLGVRVKFADKSQVAIRVPLGLNYFFRNDPFEIFGEIVPGLRVVPSTHFDFGAAAGVRYYFGAGGAGG